MRKYSRILRVHRRTASGEAVHLGKAGDCLVTRVPLGVCAAIIPWNMPVLIMGWKAGPALLAGNTLILKPASTTPLTNLRIAVLMQDAGLPKGVLNVVTGRERRSEQHW